MSGVGLGTEDSDVQQVDKVPALKELGRRLGGTQIFGRAVG